MINLMIYVSPTSSFNNPRPDLSANDAGQLAKAQIENSHQLGWKKKDMMLVTNFKWQYGTFKSKVIKNIEFCKYKPQATKINAIIKLFDKNLIKKDEMYWFHDLDAFQLHRFSKDEPKMDGFDIGLADYGRMPMWNTGTIFFTINAYDIFKEIKKVMDHDKTDEEKAFFKLTKKNKSIRKRIKRLNKTYNFTAFNLRPSFKSAIKPIKVVHFHPTSPIPQLGINNSLDFYRGINKIHTPLITGRLLRILKYHRLA